jgi:hypothetical protein
MTREQAKERANLLRGEIVRHREKATVAGVMVLTEDQFIAMVGV